MKISTSIALRANVVLFTVSTGIASFPLLTVALLFGLPDDGTRGLVYQTSIFVVALLMMGFLRWHARRAFDMAYRARLVKVNEQTEYRALISSHCRRAWLVQLHVELRGGAVNPPAFISGI
jgi:hypothetical protein